jgi:hypothetical protein
MIPLDLHLDLKAQVPSLVPYVLLLDLLSRNEQGVHSIDNTSSASNWLAVPTSPPEVRRRIPLLRLEPNSVNRHGLRVVFADSGKPTERGLCLLEPRLLQRGRKDSFLAG